MKNLKSFLEMNESLQGLSGPEQKLLMAIIEVSEDKWFLEGDNPPADVESKLETLFTPEIKSEPLIELLAATLGSNDSPDYDINEIMSDVELAIRLRFYKFIEQPEENETPTEFTPEALDKWEKEMFWAKERKQLLNDMMKTIIPNFISI